jgi:hypothetical protein
LVPLALKYGAFYQRFPEIKELRHLLLLFLKLFFVLSHLIKQN